MIFRRKRSKAQLILAYVLTSISGVKRRESSRREAWRRLISGYNKVRRTVFLTSLTLSGFESQLVYKQKRNRFCDSFFRGALQGTQSAAPPCVLVDRRSAAVPSSHFAPKNSPPDCFLNVAHPLRVRVPIGLQTKKESLLRFLFPWRAARDSNP